MNAKISGRRPLGENKKISERGYAPPVNIDRLVKRLSEPTLVLTLGLALAYIAFATGLAMGSYMILASPQLSIAMKVGAYIPVSALIGVCLRGLEGMLHEAAHKRWHKKRIVNDALGNIFAAFPLGQTVLEYRRSHMKHHKYLGCPERDPDFINYKIMQYDKMNRDSAIGFAIDVIRRYPKQWMSWFKGLTSKQARAGFLLWHGSLIAMLILSLGTVPAFQIWLLYFFVPKFFILLSLRIIGESEEHIHDGGEKTIRECTVNNMSWVQRYFIHPGRDWAHVIHHYWPGVLQVHQVTLHNHLMKIDPQNYGQTHLVRNSVVDDAHIPE